MKLTLPPRTKSDALSIDARSIVVIGANGAGKTRFARYFANSLGEKAFPLSALKALYSRDESVEQSSIDVQYKEATTRSALIRQDITGEFDRLIALLVNEAATEAMVQMFLDEKERKYEETRLEVVRKHWQNLFPDNQILVTYGKMLVNSRENGDVYPTKLLSAGEKAVFYYLGATLYAPKDAVIFADSPEMFLHASIIRPLWDTLESLRPDCTFVYTTHDLGFAATRTSGAYIWVKSFDTDAVKWDYERLSPAQGLPDDVYLAILGERKPVLFIEGDNNHSYDAKLYPLIFNEFTVKPLGSCDRVIEATRSFNALQTFHNLDAYGIVDRDRRAESEVRYLRTRRILVPEVAEIENLFMLEDVVKAVAEYKRVNPAQAFSRLRRNLVKLFEQNIKRQALEHTRHRIKKEVAYRVDGRFDDIHGLEQHINELLQSVKPRDSYNELVRDFRTYAEQARYADILRVFNYKSMLSETHVAGLCGFSSDDKKAYISTILNILQTDSPIAERIRKAVRQAFKI